MSRAIQRTWTWPNAAALGGVLALGIVLKLGFDPPVGYGLDAAYYFQIARHVAEGDGLMTSVSVFHQGLDPLPQPTITYPLWPLVMGLVGRVIGLERASTLLPEVIYVVDVLLVALLVARAAERLTTMRTAGLAGVTAAALLATNPVFFLFTSLAYTEGLAVGLVLGALVLLEIALRASEGEGTCEHESADLLSLSSHTGARARGRIEWVRSQAKRWRSASAFIGVGLMIGLAYATRYQLLTVPFVMAGVLLVTSPPARMRETLRDVALIALGAAGPFAWVASRLVSAPSFSFALFVDHSAYRQGGVLPPFRFLVEKDSLVDLVIDRAMGVFVAFDPTHDSSYVAAFGAVAFAPFAVALALAVRRRDWRSLSPSYWRTATAWRLPLVAWTIGVVATLPLHLLHGAQFKEWSFGYRQGVFALFVFWPLLGWLVTRPTRAARVVGIGLALLGLAQGALKTFALRADPDVTMTVVREEAGAWLDARSSRPRVLGMEPQPLAVSSRASFYWLACWSEPEVAATTIERFDVDLMVLGAGDRGCRSLTLVRHRLHEVRRFGKGEMSAYEIR